VFAAGRRVTIGGFIARPEISRPPMSNWQPGPGQAYSPSPYTPPGMGPHTPKRGNQTFWFLALGAVAVFVCCGGLAGIMWFGLGELERQVANELRTHPKLVAEVGEVQSMDMDVLASGLIEDTDTFVYRVRGTKASGQLTVKHITEDDWNEKVVEATLKLSSGNTVQIVP
jgi:hypothetical protein